MTIRSIQRWHELARPTPDVKAFNVQLGCHFEEVAEQLKTLTLYDVETGSILAGTSSSAYITLNNLATGLKSGSYTAEIEDRKEFADAIGDQIVTGLGVAHCANMNGPVITARVDQSNWTKFVDGKPVFDVNGKIAKPDTYQKVDLTGTY